MDWTLNDFKEFLKNTDDYDILSYEFMEEVLGEIGAKDLIEEFDLDFDDDWEIPWNEIPDHNEFEDLCENEDFITLISTYFEIDEIIFIDD